MCENLGFTEGRVSWKIRERDHAWNDKEKGTSFYPPKNRKKMCRYRCIIRSHGRKIKTEEE